MKPAALLLPAAVALLAACQRSAPAVAAPAALPPVRAHTMTVHLAPTPTFTAVTGTVRAVQRATLAAKVMGTVAELPVRLGQSVQAGDVLVQLSANEIAARVTQARAQLDQVRRDLTRERDLLARDASTADLVKALADRFKQTQAMVHEAETMLAYTTLRAPFAGTVTRKLVDVGDMAGPGQPLLELDGHGAFEVDAGIPDSLAARLAPGAALTVEVPVAQLSLTGTLAELSSAADAVTRNVPARIALPARAAIRSGQFVRIEIPGDPVDALLVPAAAVSPYGQMTRVFVVDPPARAGLRLVRTGATHGDQIEVLSGLSDGDRVIVDAPAGLREGQPLTLLP